MTWSSVSNFSGYWHELKGSSVTGFLCLDSHLQCCYQQLYRDNVAKQRCSKAHCLLKMYDLHNGQKRNNLFKMYFIVNNKRLIEIRSQGEKFVSISLSASPISLSASPAKCLNLKPLGSVAFSCSVIKQASSETHQANKIRMELTKLLFFLQVKFCKNGLQIAKYVF